MKDLFLEGMGMESVVRPTSVKIARDSFDHIDSYHTMEELKFVKSVEDMNVNNLKALKKMFVKLHNATGKNRGFESYFTNYIQSLEAELEDKKSNFFTRYWTFLVRYYRTYFMVLFRILPKDLWRYVSLDWGKLNARPKIEYVRNAIGQLGPGEKKKIREVYLRNKMNANKTYKYLASNDNKVRRVGVDVGQVRTYVYALVPNTKYSYRKTNTGAILGSFKKMFDELFKLEAELNELMKAGIDSAVEKAVNKLNTKACRIFSKIFSTKINNLATSKSYEGTEVTGNFLNFLKVTPLKGADDINTVVDFFKNRKDLEALLEFSKLVKEKEKSAKPKAFNSPKFKDLRSETQAKAKQLLLNIGDLNDKFGEVVRPILGDYAKALSAFKSIQYKPHNWSGQDIPYEDPTQ